MSCIGTLGLFLFWLVYLYYTRGTFIPEKEEAGFFLASLSASSSSEFIIAAQSWTNKGGKQPG
jgi:hypothetical protein